MLAAALGLTLLAGCFRVTTTYVRVTDPAAVGVRLGPREVLPPSSQPAVAVLTEGRYWYLLSRLPYRIDAVREPLGAVSLRCQACGHAPWPMVGVAAVPLVDAAGNVRPGLGAPRRTREALVVPLDATFVRTPRRLEPVVGARPELVIPWRSVASARVVRRPLPWWWAAVATGVGAAWVGLGGYFLHVARHESPALRYGISVPGIAIGTAVLGLGLWHLLAPTREETLRPPP